MVPGYEPTWLRQPEAGADPCPGSSRTSSRDSVSQPPLVPGHRAVTRLAPGPGVKPSPRGDPWAPRAFSACNPLGRPRSTFDLYQKLLSQPIFPKARPASLQVTSAPVATLALVEPSAPVVTSAPGVPSAPVVTLASVAPSAPATPSTPVAPSAPVVTSASVVPSTPAAPLTPVAPSAPQAPSTPVVPLAPAAPLTPVVTSAPAAPSTPAAFNGAMDPPSPAAAAAAAAPASSPRAEQQQQ
uniref:Uncharacterized protein n=1 Tax=Falco tinnunculus TaxID=100819 RepID=A0A8C4TVC3_FALTI